MSIILEIYTKEAVEGQYPDGLARSVHFALQEDGRRTELNHGYGILFAKGEISTRGTIVPKALKNPEITRRSSGGFLIRAVRTEENGADEKEKKLLYWFSEDLIRFRELSELPEDCKGAFSPESGEEADPFSRVLITEDEAEKIVVFWSPAPGKALVGFPKARGFADPVFFRHGGKWFFLFTNDNENDIGLYIREGGSIEELLSDETASHLILQPDRERGLIQNFWAPEIHEIGGELYILFAVSGEGFGPCCHMMRLKRGGDLTNPADYEAPVPVLRADGSRLTRPEYSLTEEEEAMNRPLTPEYTDSRFGISLDMTYFEDGKESYLVWSYRKDIGTPDDSGSMLMIARTSKETPWILQTDPILLSRPLYGYENAAGTINNEGPYVYKRNGRIHINYSGGDARGYLYIINLLSADEGSDLVNPASWEKRITPLCTFKTWPGVYGPGHNSFFTDENGKEWIAFHAADAIDSRNIGVGIYEYPEFL